MRLLCLVGMIGMVVACLPKTNPKLTPRRPNILIAISDDQSWVHAGAYGSSFVRTPNFDRIAREGILFNNAIVPSPGCAPSRAAMVLGHYPWENGHAGSHNTLWDAPYRPFPDLLEENGYRVGYTGKGVGPFQWALGGRMRNPAGEEYNRVRSEPPYSGISDIDYAANFSEFLSEKPADQPFMFWLGAYEPHRPFTWQSGPATDSALRPVAVPPFLPNTDTVRQDLLDYAREIEWFDAHLGQILAELERAGELDNTFIIVTSDNGMAFPAAKANAYEYGIHVPLVMRWGAQIEAGRTIDSPVDFVDFMPTILEATQTSAPETPLSGQSLMPLFRSSKSGRLAEGPTAAYSGRERHSSARWANLGYPQRAIRTERFLYVRNFAPERWPAGAPQRIEESGERVDGFHDIDAGPTLTYLLGHRDERAVAPYFRQATALRPAEQLFDIQHDSGCTNNLADNPEYRGIQSRLRQRLDSALTATGDPRLVGPDPDVFETYPRYANIRTFSKPDWATEASAALDTLVAKVGQDHTPLTPPVAMNTRSLTTSRWELVRSDTDDWELYDRKNDPDRQHDLSDMKPQTVGQLRSVYQHYHP